MTPKYNYDKLEHCADCDRGGHAETELDKCQMTTNMKRQCRSPWGMEPVYTDGLYLSSKSVKRLHKFADQIGLNYVFFSDIEFPKYRLPAIALKKAISDGAIAITHDELIKMFITDKPRDTVKNNES